MHHANIIVSAPLEVDRGNGKLLTYLQAIRAEQQRVLSTLIAKPLQILFKNMKLNFVLAIEDLIGKGSVSFIDMLFCATSTVPI